MNANYLVFDSTFEVGRVATAIAWSLVPRKRIWSDQHVSLDVNVRYLWRGQYPIDSRKTSITGHEYDGFSVPRIIRPLTFFRLTNIMPGMECIFPHDDVCLVDSFTRRDRRKIFSDGYNDAMEQFYPDYDPDAWAHAIKRGVHIGSRYFGSC